MTFKYELPTDIQLLDIELSRVEKSMVSNVAVTNLESRPSFYQTIPLSITAGNFELKLERFLQWFTEVMKPLHGHVDIVDISRNHIGISYSRAISKGPIRFRLEHLNLDDFSSVIHLLNKYQIGNISKTSLILSKDINSKEEKGIKFDFNDTVVETVRDILKDTGEGELYYPDLTDQSMCKLLRRMKHVFGYVLKKLAKSDAISKPDEILVAADDVIDIDFYTGTITYKPEYFLFKTLVQTIFDPESFEITYSQTRDESAKWLFKIGLGSGVKLNFHTFNQYFVNWLKHNEKE